MTASPVSSRASRSRRWGSAGLGSAINNAISRVGQPLLGAIIFIVVTTTFYATLGSEDPTIDTSAPTVRMDFPPLNPPVAGTTQTQLAAANEASITAFHQAMFAAAILLLIGAAVVWVGLRERRTVTAPVEAGAT